MKWVNFFELSFVSKEFDWKKYSKVLCYNTNKSEKANKNMSTVNSEGTIPITEIYLKLTIKVEADDKIISKGSSQNFTSNI